MPGQWVMHTQIPNWSETGRAFVTTTTSRNVSFRLWRNMRTYISGRFMPLLNALSLYALHANKILSVPPEVTCNNKDQYKVKLQHTICALEVSRSPKTTTVVQLNEQWEADGCVSRNHWRQFGGISYFVFSRIIFSTSLFKNSFFSNKLLSQFAPKWQNATREQLAVRWRHSHCRTFPVRHWTCRTSCAPLPPPSCAHPETRLDATGSSTRTSRTPAHKNGLVYQLHSWQHGRCIKSWHECRARVISLELFPGNARIFALSLYSWERHRKRERERERRWPER